MFPPSDPLAAAPMAPEPDPSAPAPNPMVTIPLGDDDAKKWKGDIDRAKKRRQVFEPAWERNLKAYTPDPTNEKWGDEVNPGVDFYQTEQKKASLFFDTPEVVLTPEPDTPPQAVPQIASAQTALNRKLGRKGLDTKRLMDQVLFDILCPSGMGCTKLGVTRITKDVPVDPMNPQAGTAPVPVYQKIFWEHYSPKKHLAPVNFSSTEFDKAPWVGAQFSMPTRSAIREFNLPPEDDGTPFKGNSKTADEQVFTLPGVKPDRGDEDQVTGVEIWYKAALYDDNVYHPDHVRQLVFVDGIDDPVVHRDSPYQTFQNGELQPDDPKTMIGFPIHIGTIRDLSDSAFVPSDCTINRPLVNELARFRTQLIEHRDASVSIRIANEKVITDEVLSKVVRGPHGTIIRIPDSDYDPNRPPIQQLTQPTYSRDNFTSQDKIEQDISKVSALAANQVGTEQDTVRSATELTYVQRNADVRAQAERNRVVGFFLAGVAKLDALIKRYETPPGQQPLSGYSYDIKPDSGMHVDAASARKFALDRYNMLRKDPNVSAAYLLQELAPDLHLDPSKLIVQPPPPGPEPPKISFIVKGEDINPLSPQYANMLEALKDAGMTLTPTPITPDLIQNSALAQPIKTPTPPQHEGTPEHPAVVSKHSADETGQPSNFGGQAGRVQ